MIGVSHNDKIAQWFGNRTKTSADNIYILKVLLVLALILRLDVQVSLTKEKGEVLVVLQRLLQKQDAKLAARIHSDLVSAVRLR